MTTVLEMRDALNRIIESDNNNANLDVVVFIKMKEGVEETFVMDIYSLVIHTDEEHKDKLLGLRIRSTFIDMAQMGAGYVVKQMKEQEEKLCVN